MELRGKVGSLPLIFLWGDNMGLLDILNKIPSVNEMQGNFGEQLTKYNSKAMTDALVLHDVLIDGAEGLTSQIDLLLIGTRGICVVEVKMYVDAKIYGDGKNSKWYYYLRGKKYDIYSPLKQNKKHIKYLKEFLKDFGDIPFFSILTIICDDAKVSNVNENESNIDTIVCTSLPAMKQGIKYIVENKPQVISEEKKKLIYDYIVEHQYKGKLVRQEHKENIQEINKNREELIKQKICPYCKIDLVLRNGKYGEFYGCGNYPKCRYTLKE